VLLSSSAGQCDSDFLLSLSLGISFTFLLLSLFIFSWWSGVEGLGVSFLFSFVAYVINGRCFLSSPFSCSVILSSLSSVTVGQADDWRYGPIPPFFFSLPSSEPRSRVVLFRILPLRSFFFSPFLEGPRAAEEYRCDPPLLFLFQQRKVEILFPPPSEINARPFGFEA